MDHLIQVGMMLSLAEAAYCAGRTKVGFHAYQNALHHMTLVDVKGVPGTKLLDMLLEERRVLQEHVLPNLVDPHGLSA